MSIIDFNKGKKELSDNKVIEKIVDDCQVHLDNFMHDVFQLLENEGYGEILEEKLSGMVIGLDFDANEYTTELFITDKQIDTERGKDED